MILWVVSVKDNMLVYETCDFGSSPKRPAYSPFVCLLEGDTLMTNAIHLYVEPTDANGLPNDEANNSVKSETIDSSFKFFSMKEYRNQAKKVMSYFRICGNGGDNEYIEYVAAQMMVADWKYDPNKGMKRDSYRLNCARFAILDYYNDYVKPYKHMVPLNTNIEWDLRLGLTNNDKQYMLLDDLVGVINRSSLKDAQKRAIKLRYLGGKSVSEIAEIECVTRQQINNRINRGLSHLKTIMLQDSHKHLRAA